MERSKILRWGVTFVFVVYVAGLLLATGFAQTGIDQDAYDKLSERGQEAVKRYYGLRTVVTPVTLLSNILLFGAGLGLAVLTGYLWMKKGEEERVESKRSEVKPQTEPEESGKPEKSDVSDQSDRKTIEGLKDLKSELDERLENGEIDKDEYLKLKRKYDRRIKELES